MTERELVKQLDREGFGQAYVWENGPNVYYPGHTHATETAHVIVQGEMTLTIDGKTRTYRQESAVTCRLERCTPRGWGRRAAAI
jgi:hypothetical protein